LAFPSVIRRLWLEVLRQFIHLLMHNGPLGVLWESGSFGCPLVVLWVPLRVLRGSFGPFGIVWGSFGGALEVLWGSFGGPLGVLWGLL
jgi:hypothetical protein